MKKNLVKKLICVSIASAMVAGAPVGVLAEAEKENTVTMEPVEEETVIEDIKVTTAAGEVTITNQTEKNYTAEYAEVEKAEKDAETVKIWVLTLTDNEEQKYVFEDVKVEEWMEPVLTLDLGILYVDYKDASGAAQEAAEACEEKKLDEKASVFTITNVNVREAADTEAQVLKVSNLGEEFTAIAVLSGWVKVELPDGKEGYVSHKYTTTDKELIEKLIAEAEAAAQAKREAEAAAQAQWEAQQQQQQQQQAQEEVPVVPEEQPVYEVSREKYDDCDGSGHGYYEITYSDGSVAYEEY